MNSNALTALDDYVQAHTTPEHPYLHALYRATHLQLVHARMASGPLQGQLLRMICQMLQPHTVLEIGTYSGYSALAMASGMPKGSHLVTFEINDEQEDFTRPWLEASPWSQDVRIEMIVGDIFELLPSMQLRPDLVFIDANKRDYARYFDLVIDLLPSGGHILADNTLWDGHVVDPTRQDPQTCAIRAFNQKIVADPRVECLIFPIRDGLTLIRKK